MRIFGIALAALTLSGCAGWGFDSNVSPEGIKEYYKGDGVTLYTKAELEGVNYVTLGSVEGEACQVEAQEAPPKVADARAHIRRRAADMGANGLILDSCIRFDDMPGCIEQVLCTGQAITVNKP
ncbi:exopolysaccharide biosynthesis protein [Zobellella taiwanensis]|jgi:RcsF protein|uniref:Exopolysaccharide biosynthesis protein n=1 Tax=Zobellella taiwanensis TaxID=347535 RepID=A0A2P7R6U0_9GAMM|nr:Rcs stress response system protein RcsF [Zobellella taiwanensis]PSJ45949.1 exopolysaccharide biosynthesis protein [Zobellella taiwanensis]